MEKFLLKRLTFSLERWQLITLLIVSFLVLVVFGAFVENGVSDGKRASGISKISARLARIPADTRKSVNYVLSGSNPSRAPQQRFDGEAGFTRFKAGDDEALLLARYDGDSSSSIIDIVDLKDGAVLHAYSPDVGEINKRTTLVTGQVDLPIRKDPNNYLISHPVLNDDGSVVFHGMYMPMIKIDACSNIVWTLNGFFHHSIERDADGNYWTGVTLIPQHITDRPPTWHDDGISKISPDGEILYEKSIAEIFIENDLRHLVYGLSPYIDDPFHLNDVQPVLADGPYWRRGDLFLSLRSRSAIVLYRPSTNKVIWSRQGPWTLQHDVDIISDHEIAVFNNSSTKQPWGERVMGNNDTVIYDFDTGETKTPFSDGYRINDIRTITEGLSEVLPDGEIFVEEQNYGRLLKMNQAGDVTWQYVNRAKDGKVYIVRWARYIGAALAKQTAALAAEQCG